MAIYDDFFNQNNLYSRPSSLVSNVNNYTGANQAQLPYSNNSLGSMSGISNQGSSQSYAGGKSISSFAPTNASMTSTSSHEAGPDIIGSSGDPVGDFVNKLSVLSSNQRGLLLDFIKSPGGVEPSEYAQLFNVSDEYANRFQGLPNFLSLSDQLQNVSAFGAQQRGYEHRAAQEANIASPSRQPSLTGRPQDQRRRSMVNKLSERLSSVREATAGRYNQILQNIQNVLGGGFKTQADIYAGGGGERDPNELRFTQGETQTFGGQTYYWYNGEWVTEDQWLELEEDIEGRDDREDYNV